MFACSSLSFSSIPNMLFLTAVFFQQKAVEIHQLSVSVMSESWKELRLTEASTVEEANESRRGERREKADGPKDNLVEG